MKNIVEGARDRVGTMDTATYSKCIVPCGVSFDVHEGLFVGRRGLG